MRPLQSFAVALTIAGILAASCGGRTVRTTATAPSAIDVSQLWIEPADIQTRDLFAGPVSSVAPPSPSTQFTFVKADRTGYSPGYDVRDANGLEWSVKLGKEAQTEVVSSRILWAMGYHQIPTYYLATWTMTGGPEGAPGAARFRPDLPDRKVVADWSWYENEFIATQPFKGLVVANLLLNNWDWKTSNNKIYDVTTPGERGPPRIYVVRDLGASLGKTSFPKALKWLPIRGLGQGSRNDLEGFESQAFIRGVEGNRVLFDYRGIHRELVDTITPQDVIWASELLARLSDAQLTDAFRAGGFVGEPAARYVAKIKSKIDEGLKLRVR
jgi:hypothetical protein